MSGQTKVIPISAASRDARPAFAEGERYRPGYVIAAKYRLERLIGEGGMGTVWLAHNLALEVDVAIKLIRHDVTAPEAADRLLREARAAARLDHPSIVRVFDFGQTEHRDPYIVMEVVRGESLGDLLERKGHLPATNAVQMMLPVMDALSVVHARGIVHRDVKPDNIILVTSDKGHVQPKLVDFGVVKDAPHDWSAAPVVVAQPRSQRPLTQVGVVVGSPDYMSPEQTLSSTVVDHRADIWALCVVLYEAMCGCRPFEGDDFKTLALAINIKKPAPITDHGAGDAALWAIMLQALDKDPERRWKSMRAMGCALAAWLAQRGARTDVTGAALEAHWLNEQEVRAWSEPPAVAAAHEPSDVPTVKIAVGSGRSRRALWIAVALLGLCAALLIWDRVVPRQRALELEAHAPIVVDIATTAPTAAPEAPPSAATASGEEPSEPARSDGPRTPAPMVVPKRQQAGPDDPGF